MSSHFAFCLVFVPVSDCFLWLKNLYLELSFILIDYQYLTELHQEQGPLSKEGARAMLSDFSMFWLQMLGKSYFEFLNLKG